MNNWELKIGRRRVNMVERAKYDKYFQPPRATKTIVNPGADVPTTIALIKQIVAETQVQTREIAKVLSQGTEDVREIARRIHAFVWACFDYDEEEVGAHLPVHIVRDELLREPSRIWADQKGDCDCFTIIISSILTNLNIAHNLRVAKYKDEEGRVGEWQHIYIVIPQNYNKYITIDGVLSLFDKEHTFYEAQDFKAMPTYRLGALPAAQTDDQITKGTLATMIKMVDDDPESAATYGYKNAAQFKEMLNYALANWDKNRGEVMRVLAQQEANMNALNTTVNGCFGTLSASFEDRDEMWEEYDYLEGLGKLFKKKAPKPKQASGKPAPKIKLKLSPKKKVFFAKLKDKVTGGDGKFELKDAKNLFSKAAFAPARLVLLMVVKTNVFKLKDKLKADANIYAKFEAKWLKFGGEKKALQNAIYGKGTVNGVMFGNLGVAGVDDAALVAAGIGPAAVFLIELMKEVPGLLKKEDVVVSGFFGKTTPGQKVGDKISLQLIIDVLKSIFKKKPKAEGGNSNANSLNIKGKLDKDNQGNMDIDKQDAQNETGAGGGTDAGDGGGNPQVPQGKKLPPILDKDKDGYEDGTDPLYKYEDDGTGYDKSSKRKILIGAKANFFVANPLITAGIVTAILGGATALYFFVIKPKMEEKKALPANDMKGLPEKKKQTKSKKAESKSKPKRLPVMA